mgnify:CR=1 FL=1
MRSKITLYSPIIHQVKGLLIMWYCDSPLRPCMGSFFVLFSLGVQRPDARCWVFLLLKRSFLLLIMPGFLCQSLLEIRYVFFFWKKKWNCSRKILPLFWLTFFFLFPGAQIWPWEKSAAFVENQWHLYNGKFISRNHSTCRISLIIVKCLKVHFRDNF